MRWNRLIRWLRFNWVYIGIKEFAGAHFMPRVKYQAVTSFVFREMDGIRRKPRRHARYIISFQSVRGKAMAGISNSSPSPIAIGNPPNPRRMHASILAPRDP